MRNDGFTLFETLIWLLVIFFFSILAISMGRKTISTSLTGINDNEIYHATEKYVEDGNATFNDNYTCISTDKLRNSGYLKYQLNNTRYVKVRINKLTKVVEEMYFVNNCIE